ncbi:DNA-directed RNA polymerase core subunit rpc40 [Taxawa tesnikishii (nom. ined.)]|nr:DNA-directed RNA polymerase core subunit rpc40 [Dothideales sp. JES 119]
MPVHSELRRPDPEAAEKRRVVGINPETVTNVSSTDFPHHYQGEDHAWDVDFFREVVHLRQLCASTPTNTKVFQHLRVDFHKNKSYDSVFSLIGVDAAIANAFRRIMLAELPTLAIEDIFMFNNTSIIQDEGLRQMRWFKKKPFDISLGPQAQDAPIEGAEDPDTVPSDQNTIVMDLHVKCEWRPDGMKLAKQGERDPEKLYVNSSVYASSFQFVPQGNQLQFFSEPNHIRPVNPGILIAKLRPGQEIKLRCHCIKGIGADHAKFSPVATASYRLLPTITIKEPILGADAKKFARCFPKGVIELVDDEETGEKKAVVKDTMKDTDKVQLGRLRDHFIFSVESTGQFESDELFLESVRALKVKCERFKRNLTDLMS